MGQWVDVSLGRWIVGSLGHWVVGSLTGPLWVISSPLGVILGILGDHFWTLRGQFGTLGAHFVGLGGHLGASGRTVEAKRAQDRPQTPKTRCTSHFSSEKAARETSRETRFESKSNPGAKHVHLQNHQYYCSKTFIFDSRGSKHITQRATKGTSKIKEQIETKTKTKKNGPKLMNSQWSLLSMGPTADDLYPKLITRPSSFSKNGHPTMQLLLQGTKKDPESAAQT